ncbi:MAG: DUF1501 domain-containing protein [Planctomycetes bacterium]|nr:DUF1501 domain-containing protein [Planctomycetota bacterium]
MLHVPLGSEGSSLCGKLTRRQLLQAGGLSMLGLGVPGALPARETGTQGSGSEKSCIFIVMGGGPSHVDIWDMKPQAPVEIRGPYNPIATSVPGVHINELMPRLANLSQHYSIIRSMTHTASIRNHPDAMHNCLTGQAKAPDDAPCYGSVMARLRPSRRVLTPYVWLHRCDGNTTVFCSPFISTGGFLGRPYAPFFVGNSTNHPAMPNFRLSELEAEVGATPERTLGRERLLGQLEQGSTSQAVAGWENLRERAVELATGPDARRPFDLQNEPARVRDRYGRHPLGQYLLMARRLVESGVGFVSVNGWCGFAPGEGSQGGAASFTWDMHGGGMGQGNIFGTGSYGLGWALPRLDEALSALLDDLRERGMLRNTLVVVVGEFGRTPRIDNGRGIPGRSHWPNCFSAVLAGGGIGGSVYGASDRIGAYVKDHPVPPQVLGATIYQALGVPRETQVGSRPITTGEPIHELFR